MGRNGWKDLWGREEIQLEGIETVCRLVSAEDGKLTR